ncbi:hypothetical protein [Spiroplasma endosymbiont of Cantharis rufa]|uniref:hypothetical protein n=1 Tax=Spiroplasma endosymbiont of Cantharis rufa TaxID=3066279 RepID=UPI0030D3B7D8
MRRKSDFYKSIENEFKIISEKEHLNSSGNPVNNLNTKMFYLLKHHFNSFEEFDQAIIEEISNTLQSLEEVIVKKALSFQALAKDVFNENINPQKWVDFAQKEAQNLSYEMYDESEVKYLRHFHIVWLTWVYCDEELKKLRIKASRDVYNNIGQVEKDYMRKRAQMLKDHNDGTDKW